MWIEIMIKINKFENKMIRYKILSVKHKIYKNYYHKENISIYLILKYDYKFEKHKNVRNQNILKIKILFYNMCKFRLIFTDLFTLFL